MCNEPFKIFGRYYSTVKSSGEEEHTVESWLDKAAQFASLLTSNEPMTVEAMKKTAEEQIKAMRKALKLALAQKREAESEELFVAIVRTMDMHGRRDWMRTFVEEHAGMMEKEKVVRAEIGAMHIEAMCDAEEDGPETLHPFSTGQHPAHGNKHTPSSTLTLTSSPKMKRTLTTAQHYSDLLFALPYVPASSLVVSLINVGLVLEVMLLHEYAARVYKRALEICNSPQSFIKTHNSKTPGMTGSLNGSKSGLNMASSPSPSAPEDDISTLSTISENIRSIVHSKLADSLLASIQQKESSSTQSTTISSKDPQTTAESDPLLHLRNEAKSHLENALNLRESILKLNPQDEEARNAYVRAVEALSSSFESSDASRLVWERASIVLEYGGDAAGWLSKELETTQRDLNEAQNGDISESNFAALQHRHAKVLLACNTEESLSKAIKLIEEAEKTYRKQDAPRELLDVLEDKMATLESLAQARKSPTNDPSAHFVKEQIEIIGECLNLSGQLNGQFSIENAKFLVNLSIFTAADQQFDRASDLAKAALYICEKSGTSADDDILSRAKSVLSMLSLGPKEIKRGKLGGDDSKL